MFTGNDENNSNASTNDNNASIGITNEGASSIETSPSTRQYIAVTQSSIIKRKGAMKPEPTDVEVSSMKRGSFNKKKPSYFPLSLKKNNVRQLK